MSLIDFPSSTINQLALFQIEQGILFRKKAATGL